MEAAGVSGDMGGGRLLAVLHLCDSLFPLGGFAHSDGLESATASGAVATAANLRDWLSACLDETFARSEGPTVRLAWGASTARAWQALVDIDDEATALRASAAARRATRAMGLRLVTTWQTLYPDDGLVEVIALARQRRVGPTLPVAFAAVCALSGIGQRASAEAFAYTRLAATVSAAMRLMAIGQSEAHGLLAESLRRVPGTVDRMWARGGRLESFAPALDLAGMTQQYVHSRLFRS
jgi:urease accessory protein